MLFRCKEKPSLASDFFLNKFVNKICLPSEKTHLVFHVFCPTLAKGSKWHTPSKSELFMFLYFTQCALLQCQILSINNNSTLFLLRDMLGKTPWYSTDVSGNDRHILLFYKKCHFCHLLPFAKVGQYCNGTTHQWVCNGVYCIILRIRENDGRLV